MWVNLLGVNFGKAKETGERDAAITAGKMGVTKTVTQSIKPDLFQPIGIVRRQADKERDADKI